MVLEVEAGPSKPAEALSLLMPTPCYDPRHSIPVRLKVTMVETRGTMGRRHPVTMMAFDWKGGAVADHPTAVTSIWTTRVQENLPPVEIPTSTRASDMMDPRHRGAILDPINILNIPRIVRFLHPPESDPEAGVHYLSPLPDPNDPSVSANAIVADVWKERSALSGIIQSDTGLPDLIAHTLLLADVLYLPVTIPPTVDMLSETIIQTTLVPVAEADRHLGRPMPMTASPNRLVHASTLKSEISVVPHDLPPAIPRFHILSLPLARLADHHLEAHRMLVRILVGHPPLSTNQEQNILLAHPRIEPLAGLERRPNIVKILDWLQAGHLLLAPTVSRDSGSKRFDDFPPGQTPPQVNPDSPNYGSPGSPQPYATTRLGKGGDPRYHSRSQHLPRDRGLSIPTGPAGHQRSSQSPPRPPTGPMAQTNPHGRGFSRGAFRGGMGSSRGGTHDAISSRHDQWPTSTKSNRDVSPPSHTKTARSGTPNVQGEDEELEYGSRLPQGSQVDDPLKEDKTAADQTPPSRPPPTAPTGPASSKFSFAFKTSNKSAVAAPKPEISQKFSAAPRKESQSIIDDRDRDLPKDTPREPASARARADYHHSRAPPPELPRTRKVMKTRRKLKPKPPLDPELARSNSVYFRKPGNESVIGSGTYGKVFKGTHAYTKKFVALKRIRMEGERDGFPVTAMREVKLLQSLRHTNVVELHEVMIEKNECYMVFEYLSHDLTGLLNHPTYKLDAAQKKHLAMQLFEGLDYLHTRGVLHRDIKAANILVSSDGILKLADFGLARFYAKRHQLDYTNRVITIWYRSPELLLGETRYGAAVDIWSAACVMVEIFTRHAIFPGDGGEISQLEKIYNILGTPNRKEWPGLADTPWFELLRPSYRKLNVFADKYRERVPAAAFDLLAEMFQYDPTKRPSAADVLKHPYFTIEQPPPRQAVELKEIKGDWHEFESKALRREKEKQDKQQRDARRAAAAAKEGGHDKERKRPPSAPGTQPEPKRPHIEGQVSNLSRESSSMALPLLSNAATETIAE
ncbi:kinase-like domain-containing protein [Nemania diffusa]|nr:kinase-like domain-containing protein [Nemania diffusa]